MGCPPKQILALQQWLCFVNGMHGHPSRASHTPLSAMVPQELKPHILLELASRTLLRSQGLGRRISNPFRRPNMDPYSLWTQNGHGCLRPAQLRKSPNTATCISEGQAHSHPHIIKPMPERSSEAIAANAIAQFATGTLARSPRLRPRVH